MIIMKKYRYLFLTIISVGLMVLCSCKKEKFIVSFNTLGGSYIESQEINKKDLVNHLMIPLKMDTGLLVGIQLNLLQKEISIILMILLSTILFFMQNGKNWNIQ